MAPSESSTTVPANNNNWAPGAQKVDAGNIAKPFREEIRTQIQKLKEAGIEAPLLVGLLANSDPAAKKYAEWTGKACRADGIRYELREIKDAIDVEASLRDANDDPRVHGIIVYYPIFGQVESFSGESQDDYLRDTVSYKCDVEGLCHEYRSNLYRNIRYVDYPTNSKKCVLPCTALSVVKILESCPSCYDKSKSIGRHMEGQTVTIINRSEIVGRPLAAMLANDGADVYSVDIDSIYLFRGGKLYACDGETPESCVRKSSVVVTGVPTKDYRLPSDWIQPNTTVVNVASFKNVNEDEILQIPGVTYIPMVGKVTVAMLERNLMRLFYNFHHPDHQLEERKKKELGALAFPWYGNVLQIYTAVAATVILALSIGRRK
jgi:methylenetetrahydrofolate dehydrogenase (NAD+)